MAAELKPYPGYKDSGVEWLGEVPAHWKVRRLRTIAEMRVSNVDKHSRTGEQPVRLCNYVDVYKADRIRTGMPLMAATAASEEIERFRLRPGDVLITKDSEAWDDIGVPALVEGATDDTVCGYHLALLRPLSDCVSGGFLFRAVQSSAVAYQFHVRANGVTRYGLTHNGIKSTWLPVPPSAEQAAIVRFLDHAERRIQRYIRAKEKLIALLEERKQAVIREAVTGEVDVRTGRRYPAYKSSGAEWLGNVPNHWGVEKLGQCGTIAGGMTPSMENPRFWHGSIPWITPKDMKQDVISDSSVKVSQMAVHETSLCRIEPLAVLIVVRGMILARKVPIAWTTDFVTINQDMKALVPRTAVVTEFLARLLRSAQDAFMQQVDEAGHGTRRLPTERLRAVTVTLPPKDEQERIVEHLREKLETVEAKKNGTRKLVSHFLEFRTRLIADVVTGKLDVRDAAAALPEIDPLAADETLQGGEHADDARDSRREAVAAERNEFRTLARGAGDTEFPEAKP